MSAAKVIFEKLISAGMEIAEALSLLSRHAAESAPPITTKSSAAARQQRYRDRNESVTKHNADERNETITNRNESVTRDAAIYISSNNIEEERKIDIPERNALRLQFAADLDAKAIALQRGLDIAEVASIYLDFLEGKETKPTTGGFRNFLRKHNGPERPAPTTNDQPSLADFDRAAALFVKDNSRWGSKMGPEPGMGGCRCPAEILIRHGIDPKTGLRMQ